MLSEPERRGRIFGNNTDGRRRRQQPQRRRQQPQQQPFCSWPITGKELPNPTLCRDFVPYSIGERTYSFFEPIHFYILV